MQLTLDTGLGTYQIKAYSSGQIKVNADVYTTSIIVMANHVISPWTPQTLAELTDEHFSMLQHYPIDIILLGTGPRLIFPKHEWLQQMTSRGVGIEVMDTGAACRTYNVLLSEGRRVAAALLIA